MRALVMISLVGACGFTHGTAGGSGAGGPTGPDGGSSGRPACDLTDPSLRLCLDFEPPDLGLDASPGRHDATVAGAIAMARNAEQAVTVGVSSTIAVAESADLDITGAITLELWLDPSQQPSQQFLALDNTGQYTLAITSEGKLRCSIAGAQVDSKDPIATGTWTHAGCTYDGSQLVVYVDGGVSACTGASAPIATANTAGTTIGEPFVGGLDNVHLLARAIAAAEMCAHAGNTGCNTACD